MNTEINAKQLVAFLEKLRQPQALFSITAGAALLILIVLYTQLVYPSQARIQAADRAIAEMKALKEQAESLPPPKELTESMVEEIGEMLPSKPETASLLNNLRTIERETGAEILALKRTETLQPETAEKNLSASEGQMQDFLEAVDKKEEARVVTVGSGLTEMQYELTIQGEYARLLEFMDDLRQAKRIIRIGEWRIAALSGPSAGPDGEARMKDYELTAAISFYYTDQFADLFDTAAKE